MSKRELIDAIIKHNSTAAPEFLARFEVNDLKAYLDRVCMVQAKTTLRLPTGSTSKHALVMA